MPYCKLLNKYHILYFKVQPSCNSLDDFQAPADLREGGHRAVNVLVGVRSRDLHSDPRLAPRHHGEGEADDVDPPLKHLGRNSIQ